MRSNKVIDHPPARRLPAPTDGPDPGRSIELEVAVGQVVPDSRDGDYRGESDQDCGSDRDRCAGSHPSHCRCGRELCTLLGAETPLPKQTVVAWASVRECPLSARAKHEYGQTVHLARLLLLFLVLAGGVTACDHSSNRSEMNAGRLFTGSEVRRAFAEAGIQLVADSSVTEFPQIRAWFQGGDGISVVVYESA